MPCKLLITRIWSSISTLELLIEIVGFDARRIERSRSGEEHRRKEAKAVEGSVYIYIYDLLCLESFM
jgi:hypothetical protein